MLLLATFDKTLAKVSDLESSFLIKFQPELQTHKHFQQSLSSSSLKKFASRVSFSSRQVYVLCRWESHLAGFSRLDLVDRWLATPTRARYSALIVFS